jgi:hypothetical protein
MNIDCEFDSPGEEEEEIIREENPTMRRMTVYMVTKKRMLLD